MIGDRKQGLRKPSLPQSFYGCAQYPNHHPMSSMELKFDTSWVINVKALRWPEKQLSWKVNGKESQLRYPTPAYLFVFAGSGYLEGKELQNLIQELQQARKKAGLVRSSL